MTTSKLQLILQEGKEKQSLRQEVLDTSRSDLEVDLKHLKDLIQSELKQPLETILVQQELMEKQMVECSKSVSELFHKCTQWNTSYRLLQKSLQELSNVQEWAATCDPDLQFIATGLEYVNNELQYEAGSKK